MPLDSVAADYAGMTAVQLRRHAVFIFCFDYLVCFMLGYLKAVLLHYLAPFAAATALGTFINLDRLA